MVDVRRAAEVLHNDLQRLGAQEYRDRVTAASHGDIHFRKTRRLNLQRFVLQLVKKFRHHPVLLHKD